MKSQVSNFTSENEKALHRNLTPLYVYKICDIIYFKGMSLLKWKGDLEVIGNSRKSFIKASFTFVSVILALLTSCSSLSVASSVSTVADTVVYGKIYTSNSDQKYATAFAVKDGRYIYVGTEEGVEPYIKEGTTEVIDYRGKGIVMAGATEGHGHYIVAAELNEIDAIVGGSTPEEILDNMRKYVLAHSDKEVYFVEGWEYGGEMMTLRFTYNMREALDEICSDKVIFMRDNVWHGAFMNSKGFEVAGYDKDTVIEGGEIAKDDEGNLLGFVSDIAVNYAAEKIVEEYQIISVEEVRSAVENAAALLHSLGYTNYFDAYTNMLGAETYEGLKEEDEEDGLTFNCIGAYKIDPYADIDESVAEAYDYMNKYSSKHFKADNIKLFADGGAVEVATGWMIESYFDGSHGNQVWSTDRMNEIVKKANEKGVSVHVHASGDGGTTQVVEAFINAESTVLSGVHNGLGHSRHITEDIKNKMAQHNIYSATNVCWRYVIAGGFLTLDEELYNQGYPMKSLLDKGIVMTSSTDYPANDGAPTDVCGIIEIGVNGTVEGVVTERMAEDEYLTVEEMINVMTINGAKQFDFEDERGSIEEGKYADFICIDKDITTCEKTDIHNGKVALVYFEGKEVYSLH